MKEAISKEYWCPPIVVIFFRVPGSIPTGGKLFAEIILLFTMKQYKNANIANFVSLRETSNESYAYV